jgi:hypothetical protein
MKFSSIGAKLTALAFGLLFAGMLGGTASAYPPPTGSLTMTASTTTTTVGGSVTLTSTVLSPSGLPVSGLSCTYSIVSQPGGDAAVDAGPKLTDANGIATTTLAVGSTAGVIVVGSDCGGVAGQISVGVLGVVSPPAGSTVLPTTGQGPEKTVPTWLIVLAGGFLCLAAGSGLRVIVKRI